MEILTIIPVEKPSRCKEGIIMLQCPACIPVKELPIEALAGITVCVIWNVHCKVDNHANTTVEPNTLWQICDSKEC